MTLGDDCCTTILEVSQTIRLEGGQACCGEAAACYLAPPPRVAPTKSIDDEDGVASVSMLTRFS